MPVDLQPFEELNFPNGRPEEQTAGNFIEPQDQIANFGMYRGAMFSDILLNHFGYYAWALGQEDPGAGLQDFIEFCDIALHDKS
eukprot:3172939-Alexandrium_andersonii.AAC.1